MRKPFPIIFMVMIWAAAVCAAQAVPAPTNLRATGFVNDYARVLNPEESAALEQRARALNRQLKVQVAMVTVKTVGGASIQQYSYDLAEHWGVGAKVAANGQDKDTGLLIFIAVQDHKYFTQVGYGLEPYITDADVGTWMRALRPQLRAADFGAVFSAMLDNIERTLAARMPGAAQRLSQIPAAAPANGGDQPAPGSALPFLLILALIWGLGAFATRGRGGMGGCLWPLLFFNMMGGGGGYGGGGWGGGFGGGGFGGFGGGGFGGGGAGGSW